MRILAQTNVDNRLPNLQHLDVCDNEMKSVALLSEFDSKWQQLNKLEVDYSCASLPNLVSMAERGCLSSLRELTLKLGFMRPLMFEVLESVADSLEQEVFPHLRAIYLGAGFLRENDKPTSYRQRIRRRNIIIYILSIDD